MEAHGSFATQRCIECKTEYPDERMKEVVGLKEVPRCVRKSCNGLVKPDIVFFGEELPESFQRNRSLPARADLAIIMGTSLTVQPFASLPSFVREDAPRVLINLERVGSLGSRPGDVLLLGDCDAGVRKFADALGWRDELEEHWKANNPEQSEQEAPLKTRQEKLDDEVEKLTRDIDASLKITGEATERLKAELEKDTSQIDKQITTSPTNLLSEQLSTARDKPSLSHVFPHLKDDKAEKPSL